MAFDAGVGASITAELNTEEANEYSEALSCKNTRVLRLRAAGDDFVGSQGMVAGQTVSLGDAALLQLGEGGPMLVAISDRQQILSTDYFEHFGLDTEMVAACMVVKSRGHFRAGFQHRVPDERIFEVDVPGLSCQNLGRFEWQELPRPCWPLDAEAADRRMDWGALDREAGPLFVV